MNEMLSEIGKSRSHWAWGHEDKSLSHSRDMEYYNS